MKGKTYWKTSEEVTESGKSVTMELVREKPLLKIKKAIKKGTPTIEPTGWCSIERIGEDWGYCQDFFLATFEDGYMFLFETDRTYIHLILSKDQKKEYHHFSREEWQSTLETILHYYRKFIAEEKKR